MLSLLGFLAAAVLLAHSPATAAHHASMADEPPVDVLGACLAILELAGSIALLVVVTRPQRLNGPRWRPPRDAFRGALPLISDQRLASTARAGPAVLQVFRL